MKEEGRRLENKWTSELIFQISDLKECCFAKTENNYEVMKTQYNTY